MKFFKKWLEAPVSNETEMVEAAQLWEVRWESRSGEYSGCTRPEIEAFPSQLDAERFAEALRNAFKLIRHTSGTNVTVRKAVTEKPRLAAVQLQIMRK